MNKTSNHQYWEDISVVYDKNVGEKGDIRHEKIINPFVLNFLGNLSNKIILDAGCGNGYLSRIIANNARKVIGVDSSEKLIKLALKKKNPTNTEFFLGDLENLKFNNNFFDSVLCNMVLIDIKRLNKVISELSRVLKLNGILIISTLHPCFENPPKTYSLFDKNGKRIGRVIKNYFTSGLVIDSKNEVILNHPYQHYHYTISAYINAFSNNNLMLKKVIEPNGYLISKESGMSPDTPTFIIFKLEKIN